MTSLLAAAFQPERVRAPGPVRSGGHARRFCLHAAGPLQHSPLVAGALRRRATYPNRQAAFEAYRGRGPFRTWSDAQLADYLAAGLAETETGEVGLTCTPEWEASNFRTHNYDAWAAFRESRCPIRILRAAEASTFRLEGCEDELSAGGRIAVETVPGTTHFLPMERPDLVRRTLAACVAL